MKYLFLLMCVISGLSLSVLSVVIATGRIPFGEPITESVVVEVPAVPVGTDLGEDASDGQEALSRSAVQVEAALNAERKVYDEKLSELESREKQLDEKEQVLNLLRDQIEQLRADLESRLNVIAETEQANMALLAEMYSKMGAEEAAMLLGELPPEQASTILSMVGDRQAAGILAAAVGQGAAGASMASEWTDLIRRMDSEQNNE